MIDDGDVDLAVPELARLPLVSREILLLVGVEGLEPSQAAGGRGQDPRRRTMNDAPRRPLDTLLSRLS
jgi:hypothetical protein